jgi:hypothetical protein
MARRMYVQEGVGILELQKRLARQKIRISRQTLSRWKADDNWDELRRRYKVSSEAMLPAIDDSIVKLSARLTTCTDAERLGLIDGIHKALAIKAKIEGGTDIMDEAVRVVDRMLSYIETHNRTDIAEVMSTFYGGFIRWLAESERAR